MTSSKDARRRAPRLRGRDRRAGAHGDRHASARTPVGYRLSLRLHPETDVQQVYDAFETGPDEHFLGGGERGDCVDLRGQILQIKVAEPCTYAPVPFFASSAGWGVRLRDARASRRSRSPARPAAPAASSATSRACGFPPLEDRAEVCVQGARLDEDLYVGLVRRRCWTPTRRRRASRACRRRRSSS